MVIVAFFIPVNVGQALNHVNSLYFILYNPVYLNFVVYQNLASTNAIIINYSFPLFKVPLLMIWMSKNTPIEVESI